MAVLAVPALLGPKQAQRLVPAEHDLSVTVDWEDAPGDIVRLPVTQLYRSDRLRVQALDGGIQLHPGIKYVARRLEDGVELIELATPGWTRTAYRHESGVTLAFGGALRRLSTTPILWQCRHAHHKSSSARLCAQQMAAIRVRNYLRGMFTAQ